MAVSSNETYTDLFGREVKNHGSAEFPIACYENTLTGSEITIHWHEELELILVLSGQALLCTSNGKIPAGSGCCVFVNSNILHTIEPAAGRVHIRSLVFHSSLIGGSENSIFRQKYLLPLMESSAVLPYLIMPREQEVYADILQLTEHAWQAMADEPAGFEIRVRNDLSECILFLQQKLSDIGPMTFPGRDKREERLKAMLSYIHTEYSDEISVQKIADAGYISKSECLRCFRDGLSTSPMQYVNDYRVKAAANLLRTTDWSVSEIGSRCGFTEMGYFSGRFKKKFGCTPSAYRLKAYV